jgi:hypothetical protein
MIVFMNPPYGTNGEGVAAGSSKKGISDTEISNLMKEEDFGSSQQLYSQFLFRLKKLNNENIKICVFSPPLFLSGPSFKKFRKNLLTEFGFQSGFLMNAGEFDGTSEWGLSFTIWNEQPNDKKEEFTLFVKKSNDFGIIDYLFDKVFYNLDNHKSGSDFIKRNFSKENILIDLPKLSSSIKIGSGKNKSNSNINSIGYFVNVSNNVMENTSGVYLLSSPAGRGQGIDILTKSFFDIITNFTSRKSIKSNWINQKDEYMAPDESHPLWKQFQLDSIVYSLFNTSSNQSSLRQIDYKDKKWDIKNEFFWMSKSDMLKLASEHSYDELYRDARTDDERHVYNLLHNEAIYTRLSPDAREVLDMATELVKKSFPMRKVLNEQHPEYHLNTWDAGWYQIKLILKKFYPADLIEFGRKYKAFEDRMRPLVYEVGFLRK